MRILHTGDLHLGHTLYGYDRFDEQLAMLRDIEKAVTDHKPDALIISGDIFHTSQPSAAVQRMFSESLSRIHRLSPDTVVVAIAGNHDSPSRHEVFRTPWRELNVYAIGIPDTQTPDNHIIEIPGKGFIIAVPYIYGRNMPEGFYHKLLGMVEDINKDSLPVVMAAHTAVAGCDFKGHEGATERTIGGVDSVSIDEIGDGYDYLALGHIHRPQTLIGSRGKARYSGTPIAVSFDEDYAHSITLVDIDRHGLKPEIRTIEIDNPHPLVTLPAHSPLPWDEVKPLLSSLPEDKSCYIRVLLLVDSFLPVNVKNEAEEICWAKGHRFCLIRCERPSRNETDKRTLTVNQFRQLRPVKIMEMFAESEGIELTSDILKAFKEAADQSNADI